MVGGRSGEPPPQYCRPGEPAIANHQTHHEVNNELSRRLVEECGITSWSEVTARDIVSMSSDGVDRRVFPETSPVCSTLFLSRAKMPNVFLTVSQDETERASIGDWRIAWLRVSR